ncbi:Glyoxalase/bleomycin resistance protein/dioxygenase [[Leptolyngbya] sp. PCC 7376]|uniref:VOC family protein n=1 Tax=[Leptolyngbya] sp. PCC 7376 TaxID=111781 RepID=UPI00029EDBA5|nr:VOC family protein [[Leptolyngbya] sp. PCC 7376]AFY38231.1 Glyoxalase/bleomycin resistance protein/dioxygenase [[Leptolyngbya] sp. PCC 7376]
MSAQFRHIMLMVKDVAAAVQFYHEGLGLPIKVQSPGWAEIEANGATIAFHGAAEAPQTGSSPILSFTVDDVHQAIANLETLGGKLEGRVREPSFGKVAAVRSPQGHLVSLLQPVAQPTTV